MMVALNTELAGRDNVAEQGTLRVLDTPDDYYHSIRNRSRSTLEKVLLVVVVVLVSTVIALVAVLAVTKRSQETAVTNSEVCLTKGCVSAAARIDSFIDYSVPSCSDFYQFSCGKWMQSRVIPNDQSSLDTFVTLRDQVTIVLKNLLQGEDSPTDTGTYKKARNFYRACMNTELINSRNDTPLRDFLSRELKGWPLTTRSWSESSFNLVKTMVTIASHNVVAMIRMYVSIDSKNSSTHILKIDQPSLSLPGLKYYLVDRNDSMIMALEELIFQIGQLLGLANPATARKEVSDIVDFEIRLANISVPAEKRRDNNALHNPMTLAEIHGNYSSGFDWRTFVRSLLSKSQIGLGNISDDEIIINISPTYYQQLTQLLVATPKRTLANYIIWRMVRSLVNFLGDNYRSRLLDYRKAIFGASTEPDRFKICVGITTEAIGPVVGQMFIKDNFDSDSKDNAVEMIKELQEAFNELLDHVDWMDEDTKKVAMEKNGKISSKIGYHEEITNDTYLEQRFINITYNKDQYFENYLILVREEIYENARKLRQTVDKNKWEYAPSTVNAMYSSVKNQIMFPAGILQPPFFSKSYPKSLNLAGIGVIIGHEVTHGFDDRGRQFDSNGNLVQWWSQSAVDKFKDKANCIVQQYSNYTMPENNMNLNGINTLGENIADNGGLKQAFRAYRNWIKKQGKEEPKLPGLDFNGDQLFFINFAQMWCSLTTEKSVVNRIRVGVHSPGRFRVIGCLQNSPDFAKVFNCPINSYMNPQEKCSVW